MAMQTNSTDSLAWKRVKVTVFQGCQGDVPDKYISVEVCWCLYAAV